MAESKLKESKAGDGCGRCGATALPGGRGTCPVCGACAPARPEVQSIALSLPRVRVVNAGDMRALPPEERAQMIIMRKMEALLLSAEGLAKGLVNTLVKAGVQGQKMVEYQKQLAAMLAELATRRDAVFRG